MLGRGIESQHSHRTPVGRPEALQHLDGGRLAGAVRAEDRGHGTGLGGEGEAFDGDQVAVANHQVLHLDRSHDGGG